MRSAAITLALTLAAALAVPCAAPGAQTATLAPGARVRVTTPDQPHARQVGTLLALQADSIHLRRDGRADSLSIPLTQVTAIEVSQGRRTQGRRGLGYGFLAGAAIGMAIGIADGDDPPDHFIRFTAAEKAMLGGATLGVAGGILGGIVGLASPAEAWRRVPRRDVTGRVGVVPRPGGLGLAVTLRY